MLSFADKLLTPKRITGSSNVITVVSTVVVDPLTVKFPSTNKSLPTVRFVVISTVLGSPTVTLLLDTVTSVSLAVPSNVSVSVSKLIVSLLVPSVMFNSVATFISDAAVNLP